MHILRWLFVRPVVLVSVLALITILLNWIVAGQQPEKDKQSVAGEQKTEYVAVDDEAPQNNDKADTDKTTQTEASHAVDNESDTATGAATEAAGQATKQGLLANVDDADNEAQAVTQETDAVGEAMAVQTQSDAESSADQEQQQTQSDSSSTGASDDQAAQAKTTADEAGGDSSAADLLRAAREAYWSKEFDRSVDFYNSLLELDPQPAYKGELANVYWKQGKNQQAVDLYTEIASWMAEQGRTDELISIKVYADLVDPDKAAEIGQYLD